MSVNARPVSKRGTVGVPPEGGSYALATVTPKVIRYSSSWPARSTVTSVAADVVMWSGPTPPTVGGSGMGVNDVYLRTTS